MKKILSAALALVCVWFATPARAALPSGYTELQYIESTGTQYIDTGFSPDANTRVDYKGQLLQFASSVPLLGARLGSDNPGRFFPLAWYTNANAGRIVYGDKEVMLNISTSTIYTGSFIPAQEKTIINGITYDISGANFTKTADNNFYLFATSGYGSLLYNSVGRIWYVKIWDNNTLVRDMVPAKNSSGVVGMYDTVEGRFYENAGTGEFIAGDPVTDNSCRNLFPISEISGLTGWGIDGSDLSGPVTELWTQHGLSGTGFTVNWSPNTRYTISYKISQDSGISGSRFRFVYTDGTYEDSRMSGGSVSFTTAVGKTVQKLIFVYTQGTGNILIKDLMLSLYNCSSSIKIATTKYNETAFGPLNTALANAISVVDTVVSNTITQAASVATLQAQKQTRPNDIADDNEKCPAGIKCLLVEDATGVPHWYAIQESYLPLGYTPLKYINKPSGAYTDSGIKFTSENVTIEITGSISSMVDGMFGAQDGSNNHSALLIYANHLYAGENGFVNPTIFDSGLHKIIIEANNKNITLTNYAGEVVNLSYTQSIQSRNGWYIGGMRSNDRVLTNSIGKVGIIKIWDNGNLVFHGIPAKYGEEIGFYDIVQNRFLTSMSEQKFTAGPVAE